MALWLVLSSLLLHAVRAQDQDAGVRAQLEAAGHKLGKSTIAPDGKSGHIQLAGSGEKELWTPAYLVSGGDLRRQIKAEDLLMVLFFSSDESDIKRAQTAGLEFEKAAKELLEGELQLPMLMLDAGKDDGKRAAKDFDVAVGEDSPVAYVVFKDGRPTRYRGRTDAASLVEYMMMRAGPPTTRVDTAKRLDEILSAASETVVVGSFGGPPGITGPTAQRESFRQAAEQLRESVRFVEADAKVANAAAPFASAAPFEEKASGYAIVLPPRWVAKAEPPFAYSTDFKTVLSSAADAFPLVAPLTDELVQHSVARGKLLAVLLYDGGAEGKMFRYVHKQLHRLVASEPSLREQFSFAIESPRPLHPYLEARFDQTAYRGELVTEWVKVAAEFMLLVSNVSHVGPESKHNPGQPTSTNWLYDGLVGTSADRLDATRLAPFLRGVASRDEPPVLQNDLAADSLGLKMMEMGIGGEPREVGGAAAKKKKSKKRKGKKGRAPGKDEV